MKRQGEQGTRKEEEQYMKKEVYEQDREKRNNTEKEKICENYGKYY